MKQKCFSKYNFILKLLSFEITIPFLRVKIEQYCVEDLMFVKLYAFSALIDKWFMRKSNLTILRAVVFSQVVLGHFENVNT